jgi:ATP-dependent protease HslVU (ClpYQ) peptidase subunit
MTTIAAKQTGNKVVIGADSQVTAVRKYSHPVMAKVTERGQFLIAGAGESAACDIAQHIWIPPNPNATDKKNLYHFMITKVVPSLRQAFKDNDYKYDKDSTDDYNFLFLIAVNGEVFEVADDFSVCIDVDGIYGIGSGSSYAIGALKAGADLNHALSIAANLDAHTSSPFYFYEQVKRG